MFRYQTYIVFAVMFAQAASGSRVVSAGQAAAIASAPRPEAVVDVATTTFVALRNVRVEDYEAIKSRYLAVAESCNTCHRRLATDVPAIRP